MPDLLSRGMMCLLLWGALGGIFALKAPRALERRPEGFPVPDVSGCKFQGDFRRDLTPLIPGEETVFKNYLCPDGRQVEVIIVNGHLLGYNIDEDGQYPFDYTLLDLDGDGIFETKDTEGKAEIPEWVLKPEGPKRADLPRRPADGR
jgi:hypothetical protein